MQKPHFKKSRNEAATPVVYGTFRYTDRERLEKTSTVGKAVTAARLILNEKKIQGICMNAVHNARLELSDAITLEKHNEICSQIVDDSIYYA